MINNTEMISTMKVKKDKMMGTNSTKFKEKMEMMLRTLTTTSMMLTKLIIEIALLNSKIIL